MEEDFLSDYEDESFGYEEPFEGKDDEYNELGNTTEYRSKTLAELTEDFNEVRKKPSKLTFQFVSHIEEACGVAPEEAISLLQHYLWDKDKLLEDWFSDYETVAKKVGIAVETSTMELCEDGEWECPICMDSVGQGSPDTTFVSHLR